MVPRQAGSGGRCRSSGMTCMCVCWTRGPGNCCASTYARSAVATGSRTRTVLNRRHGVAASCCAGRKEPGPTSAELCHALHGQQGELAVRRILGVLALGKKYGTAAVDDACAAGLEMGVREYRFVRRYLERKPQLPLSLRQVDPLIRQLTLYRDIIQNRTQERQE